MKNNEAHEEETLSIRVVNVKTIQEREAISPRVESLKIYYFYLRQMV